ncbi:MAG: hypothetical protein JW976_05135 [Syntrophaceae bacterium]|nr:hypothetical protein [Syntrophaceae bacterium]
MTVLYFFANLSTMEKEITNTLIRCPRLGDEVTFSYCLRESGDLPCSRIMRCWSHSFDVEAILKDRLAPETLEKFLSSQPKDKVSSLLELIETAKAKK